MRSSAQFVASIWLAVGLAIPVVLGLERGAVRVTHAQALAARPDAKVEQGFADPRYRLTGVAGSAKGRTIPDGLFRLELP
jgi:hypothetical protein